MCRGRDPDDWSWVAVAIDAGKNAPPGSNATAHQGEGPCRCQDQRWINRSTFGGFCAETAGAITIIGVTLVGIPISTTHTITGAIIGVGATRRFSAVKWGVAGRIVWAWVLTIPIAAAISALSYNLLGLFY